QERAGRAIKRAPERLAMSLDVAKVEREIAASYDVSSASSPEAYFDGEWTRNLFKMALDRLRDEGRTQGKELSVSIFERYDIEPEADAKPSYKALATELGLEINDVTARLAYGRRTFRRIVLEILAEITASEEEFRNEARSVLGIEV